MSFELGPENAVRYLRESGVVPVGTDGVGRALGGGVSNRVVMADTDAGCFVLKQPLANLAVEDDWPADLTRIRNEANAARAYAGFVTELEGVHIPEVVFESQSDHVAVFSCAPQDAVMWKTALLDGDVDHRVARILGRVLGSVHSGAATDDRLRSMFERKTPFSQLRIEPYHRTVARRHPDVAAEIELEIARVLDVSRTLVHGDYSPKNVLLMPGEGRPVVWVIDFEVAHWGDPAFDVAFMLNHLLIKSVYNRERQAAYFEAADAFWSGYRTAGFDIEHETVRELGVLLLARVDGKSPVEYVDDPAVADVLRTIAKRSLLERVDTLNVFRDLVERESDTL